jgi:hypothetical protein
MGGHVAENFYTPWIELREKCLDHPIEIILF